MKSQSLFDIDVPKNEIIKYPSGNTIYGIAKMSLVDVIDAYFTASLLANSNRSINGMFCFNQNEAIKLLQLAF